MDNNHITLDEGWGGGNAPDPALDPNLQEIGAKIAAQAEGLIKTFEETGAFHILAKWVKEQPIDTPEARAALVAAMTEISISILATGFTLLIDFDKVDPASKDAAAYIAEVLPRRVMLGKVLTATMMAAKAGAPKSDLPDAS